jgi:hypothetical protein
MAEVSQVGKAALYIELSKKPSHITNHFSKYLPYTLKVNAVYIYEKLVYPTRLHGVMT